MIIKKSLFVFLLKGTWRVWNHSITVMINDQMLTCYVCSIFNYTCAFFFLEKNLTWMVEEPYRVTSLIWSLKLKFFCTPPVTLKDSNLKIRSILVPDKGLRRKRWEQKAPTCKQRLLRCGRFSSEQHFLRRAKNSTNGFSPLPTDRLWTQLR